MGTEEDIRELRRMFAEHIDKENSAFVGIANFHGEIRVTMNNIQERLNSGSDCFGETESQFKAIEVRLDKIENTLSHWKGWGAAILIVSTAMGQVIVFGFKAMWAHLTKQS